MNEWLLLFGISTAGALLSLIGGIFLLYGKRTNRWLQWLAIPLAAGALLAAVFFDLIPEALAEGDAEMVMRAALIGFLLFFVLERGIGWFHHHHHHKAGKKPRLLPKRHHNKSLIIVGDSLHNFIDGLAIGAAFLVSPATGMIMAAAVALHEIPQEIGDFGLLLKRGMKKRSVLIVNLVSSLLTVIGASLVFGLGDLFEGTHSLILGFTAGCFLYIAASDIIPTLHNEPSRRLASIQAGVLLISVVTVGWLTEAIHELDIHDHEHDTHSHIETDH